MKHGKPFSPDNPATSRQTGCGDNTLQFGELQKGTISFQDDKHSSLSIKNWKNSQNDRSKHSEIPEELITLMSKGESNIPEVLSIIEKTDKSGSSIQKTISEVIRQLSVDEKSSKSSNITEDMAKELQGSAYT